MSICEKCGSEFVASRSDARYCGEKCKKAAQRGKSGAEGKVRHVEDEVSWDQVLVPKRIEVGGLEGSRGKFVVAYRAHKANWPDGPGAWYRDEDWDVVGNLTATGEARMKALDPFANDRAKGLPCPALGEAATKVDPDLARGSPGKDHRLGR